MSLKKINPNEKLGVHAVGDDEFVMGGESRNSKRELDGAVSRNPVIGKG